MSEDNNSTKPEASHKEKEVAFYSALVNAWISSRMEKDKSILTLSAGGVGLLVTLLVNFGIKSQCELLTYMTSIGGFLIAIFITLFVFERNTAHLKAVITENKQDDPILQISDKAANTAFLIGVIFLVFSGAATVFRSETLKTNKVIIMCDKDKPEKIFIGTESYNGIADLRPKPPAPSEKSLNDSAASSSTNKSSKENSK
jgi:hypothetical protein